MAPDVRARWVEDQVVSCMAFFGGIDNSDFAIRTSASLPSIGDSEHEVASPHLNHNRKDSPQITKLLSRNAATRRKLRKIRGLRTLSIINLFGAEPPDSPATPGASGYPRLS